MVPRREIAPLAAQAAWQMRRWEDMSTYLEAMDSQKDSPDAATCSFLQSVSAVHKEDWEGAWAHMDNARDQLSTDLAALAGESYERAYECMVRVQQLTELEEAISYKTAAQFADGKSFRKSTMCPTVTIASFYVGCSNCFLQKFVCHFVLCGSVFGQDAPEIVFWLMLYLHC